MAPKADPKKKKESESTSEEESYEYETESSSDKPAPKKADEKKPAVAAAEPKKDAAKPAAKKAESSSDEESYEYETESESSQKKKKEEKKTVVTTTVAVTKVDEKKPAAAAAKADDKKKEADKKKSESDEDEDEYEYESEYESESEEKKPAAKAGATATAAKPATKADDKKPAAAVAAKATTTTMTTTTTTKATTTSAAPAAGVQREVVVAAAPLAATTAKDWAASFLAEFIGTFILCYVIFQFRLQTAAWTVQEVNGGVVSYALVQAFAIAVVTAAFGHVSGGHFNPAVSLTMMILRQTTLLTGLAYIVLQFAGAVIAGLLAWGLAPPATQFNLNVNPNTRLNTYGTGFAAPFACSYVGGNFTAPVDNPVCWQEGFGAEIVGTFFFLMIYLMCFVAGHGETPWLSVGVGLGMNVFAFYTTSNAYFNPARAIGGAVFTFGYDWTNFWIYIIGPFIGSLMAVIVFGLIFQTKGDKTKGENLLKH